MSSPFLGEIRALSSMTAPKGWAKCDGQSILKSQNPQLFALIGNTYGPGTPTTFLLPDLRGRTPIHMSSNYAIGNAGGESSHVVITQEMPSTHTHTFSASTDGALSPSPTGAIPATANGRLGSVWATSDANKTAFSSAFLATINGNAHVNMQPYLVVTLCIALSGIYPERP